MRAINHALARASNFLQQFIVAEISRHLCRPHRFLSICCLDAFIAAGLSEPSYRFLVEQTKATFQKIGQTPFVASPEIFAPRLPQTPITSFTAAYPCTVLEIADRRATDRTWDRGGAAQE